MRSNVPFGCVTFYMFALCTFSEVFCENEWDRSCPTGTVDRPYRGMWYCDLLYPGFPFPDPLLPSFPRSRLRWPRVGMYWVRVRQSQSAGKRLHFRWGRTCRVRARGKIVWNLAFHFDSAKTLSVWLDRGYMCSRGRGGKNRWWGRTRNLQILIHRRIRAVFIGWDSVLTVFLMWSPWQAVVRHFRLACNELLRRADLSRTLFPFFSQVLEALDRLATFEMAFGVASFR